jgi:hypothetical protein
MAGKTIQACFCLKCEIWDTGPLGSDIYKCSECRVRDRDISFESYMCLICDESDKRFKHFPSIRWDKMDLRNYICEQCYAGEMIFEVLDEFPIMLRKGKVLLTYGDNNKCRFCEYNIHQKTRYQYFCKPCNTGIVTCLKNGGQIGKKEKSVIISESIKSETERVRKQADVQCQNEISSSGLRKPLETPVQWRK